MVKRKYILFLILIVTIINLFYKPFLNESPVAHLLQGPWISTVNAFACPLYGFKCPTDEACDCHQICGNGEYVSFQVMEGESIYLMDQKLVPGTYCLPKGVGDCNQTTSHHVFSSSGWTCIPRNKSIFQNPCYSDDARDNSKNVLWDHLKNKPAENIENAYETLSDGKTLRFRCKCDSPDARGHAMVNTLPFTCSVDYCIQDIPNPLPMMKFIGNKCECGPYLHEKDETSRCVVERSRVEQNVFTGRVNCMTNFSWKKKPIFCPFDEEALSFRVPVKSGNSPLDFVSMAIQ